MFGCIPNRVQVNHSRSQMLESVTTMLSLSRGLDSTDFINITPCTIAIRLHIET